MLLKGAPFLLALLLAGALFMSAATSATLADLGVNRPTITQDELVSLRQVALPMLPDGDHTPFDPAQLRPDEPYPGAGYPWQRVARAVPADWRPSAPPPGIDLDVTFISRTPKYKAYCVMYLWGAPDQPGIPALCPGTEGEQRWPATGEVVTFTAHIANKGTLASPAFAYRWEIDGVEVASGMLSGLAAGAEATASYQWLWGHVMDGERATDDHTVRFTADPLDAITETYETNNTLEDRTNALGFRIAITPEMIQAYNTPWNPAFSYSAEDWLQRQIAAMDWVFANSVYPTTPTGATERVRIDEIVVTSASPINDRSSDGGWFVDADYRIVSGWYDPATDIDWALVHELSHQVGVIDLYQLNMSTTSVHVLDLLGQPANFGFSWPRPDLMGGGDIAPHTDGHLYSSHGAAGFSSTKGYRRGYYGEYQFDIPAENWLLVLDNQGGPAAGVEVSLYQRNGPVIWPGDITIDNVPEFVGKTGTDGRVRIANRQIVGGPWSTATGHVLRDNPFGVVDVVGGRNRFLVKLAKGSHEEFTWLDIADFNLAYWRGDTLSHTFTLASHVPAATIPAAPSGVSAEVGMGQVTLRWQASLIPEVSGYTIYRATGPTYGYERISDRITGNSYLTECHGGDCIYTVTALDFDGRESGFSRAAWAPDLVLPSSLVIVEDRVRTILDTHAGPLIRQRPDERYLGRIGSVHFGLTGSRFLAIDPQGHFLVTDPGRHTVRVTDPAIQPLFEFGEYGTSPGQFREPAGVAVWGQPCTFEGPYANDSRVLLLLHFDGSYVGASGEAGIASGASFAPGRYDQGLLIDASDTLSYETVGNLNREQGAIEFWVRPDWDGNDGKDYVFFEVGAGWFNRMMIIKDGANNLRLIVWDSAHEYGVGYNVGYWRAGEWHHVAATWDASSLALYVGGQMVDRNTNARSPDWLAARFSIGSSVQSGSQVNATIDEFRISDVPRIGNSDTCSYRILVADSGNNRIQAFDAGGSFVSAYGVSGSGPGEFNDPQGLAVDDRERIIVADRGNGRLQLLSFDGQTFSHLRTIGERFVGPTGLWAYGSDRILVAETGSDTVKELIPEGDTYVVKEHRPQTPFSAPRGVAADRDGNLIVADTGNRRIVTIPGALPTFTPTPTPSISPTPTPSPTASLSPTPTRTPSPTTVSSELILTGLVYDASVGRQQPLPQAHLFASTGQWASTAFAGFDGRYTLIVPRWALVSSVQVAFVVRATGYQNLERTVSVAALLEQPVQDFGLWPTADIVVNTPDDELNNDGDCSLREAIQAANTDQSVDACPAGSGGDTIYVPEGAYLLALPGAGEDANASGDLDILDDLKLIGAGIKETLIDGRGLDRVFHVHEGVTVLINGVMITGGRTPDGSDSEAGGGDAGPGGGIANFGDLTLVQCGVNGNRTGDGGDLIATDWTGEPAGGNGGNGGGIFNAGVLHLVDASVVGNATGSGGAGGTGDAGHVGRAGAGGGVYSEGKLSLERVTVSRNLTGTGGHLMAPTGTRGGPGGPGGGVYSVGSAVIIQSTIADNRAGDGYSAGTHGQAGAGGAGGGIYNGGEMLVRSSTISGNASGNGGDAALCGAGGDGGGIAVSAGGSLWLYNSTISGNRTGDGGESGPKPCAGGRGGGIYTAEGLAADAATIVGNMTGEGSEGEGGGLFNAAAPSARLRNTILALNRATSRGPDCVGITELAGHTLLGDPTGCHAVEWIGGGPNIIGKDPLLLPLGKYGGPTMTHALAPASPALDAGSCVDLRGDPIREDQRGVARPQGPACDIGAYEEEKVTRVYLPLVFR